MHKPLKEMHPPVFVATHWINLVAITILMASGLYIHFPLWGGLMGVARGLHVFFGIIIFANVVFRIVATFFVKDAVTMNTRETKLDLYNWLPQEENRHQFIPMLKWYLFMKKDYPISAKYATMQKISYLAIAVMLLGISYTGFCLWNVTNRWALFSVGVSAPMTIRTIHYTIAWALVIIALVHIYIATMHGMSAWRMIFLHKEDPDAGEQVDAPAQL